MHVLDSPFRVVTALGPPDSGDIVDRLIRRWIGASNRH